MLTARITGPNVGERETPIINSEINDIMRAFGPRMKTLVLDLSEVKVMSSMALGMCLDLKNRARMLGAQTTTIGVSGEMDKVLRQLKLAGRTHAHRFPAMAKVSNLFTRAFAAA